VRQLDTRTGEGNYHFLGHGGALKNWGGASTARVGIGLSYLGEKRRERRSILGKTGRLSYRKAIWEGRGGGGGGKSATGDKAFREPLKGPRPKEKEGVSQCRKGGVVFHLKGAEILQQLGKKKEDLGGRSLVKEGRIGNTIRVNGKDVSQKRS